MRPSKTEKERGKRDDCEQRPFQDPLVCKRPASSSLLQTDFKTFPGVLFAKRLKAQCNPRLPVTLHREPALKR